MIGKIEIIIVLYCLLFPTSVCSEDLESNLLFTYINALTEGDLTKLDSLLSKDFEYNCYSRGERKSLNRDEELQSTGKLFQEARTKSFNKLELFERGRDGSHMFHFRFLIGFEDSPKVYNESIFRGALLEIDETAQVIVKKDKICKIIEIGNEKRKNLSYGLLKYIYTRNTEVRNKKIKRGWMFELFDKKTNELLLIKKSSIADGTAINRYFWPDGRVIANFQ